jgi:hypothetical protein
MDSKLIATNSISTLVEGSFEAFSEVIRQTLIQESQRLFGNETDKLKIIGTFKNHVIVVNENAKFAKVMFETTDDGQIIITGLEDLKIPVYEDREVLLKEQALVAVDSILAGNISEGRSIIKDLVRLSPGDTSFANTLKVQTSMGGLDSISESLDRSVELGADEYMDTYQAKYQDLQMSSETFDINSMKPVIESNLLTVIEKLDLLKNKTDDLVAKLEKVSENSADSSKKEFLEFMKTFASDLVESKTAVVYSMSNVVDVKALGQLYDLASERFKKQEHIFNQLSDASEVSDSALTQ